MLIRPRSLPSSTGGLPSACPVSPEPPMRIRSRLLLAGAVLAAAVTVGHQVVAWAQLMERPGTSRDDPNEVPRDLTGLSIKNPRVRVVHTTDPAKAGGSLYLQQADPWLGYQWGRSLVQR